MLNIHVIQAEFGDCILLQYGNSDKFILMDGGPSTVYDRFLRSAIERIVTPGGEMQAVIVTHIDIDHIKGILELLAELKKQKDTDEDPLITIKELWINTFSETIDPDNSITNRLNEIFSIASTMGINMASTGIALLGIKEGDQLTTFCNLLRIPMNAQNQNKIFKLGQPANPIVFDNLSLTIVGPTQENIDNLKAKWQEWLEEREAELASASLLSMSDKSIPNLSSLMFLLEADDKTYLFTGDGRGDHLIEGLKKKNLLNNGRLHINVLKVPHHGSDRNTTRGFFENITADTYIISANGKHGNPDYTTLTWIVESAHEQGRNIKLIITNKTDSTKRLLRDYDPGEFGYEIVFIADGENFITLTLQ